MYQVLYTLLYLVLSVCACMHAQSLQSWPTLCNPLDHSLPGSSVHELSRQEYWSGLPCPPPEDLHNPGIEPVSCISYIAGGFFTTEPPGKPNWPHIPPPKEGKSNPKIFLTASYARNDGCFPMCYPISSIPTTLWAGNYNSYFFKWDNQGSQQLNKLPQITELTCG